jgi:hypothetical protein
VNWPTPVSERLGRRIGHWRHVHGCGWQFTGTNVVIDKNAGFDGGWYITTASGYVQLDGVLSLACEEIDHYLDASMAWIEQHLIHYINATNGQTCGNCGLVHA